jgi:hypothetical protein
MTENSSSQIKAKNSSAGFVLITNRNYVEMEKCYEQRLKRVSNGMTIAY